MYTAYLKGFVAIAGIAIASMLMSCGSNPDTAPTGAAAIVISGPSSSVAAGGMLQLTATATDANGDPLSITPTWSVSAGGGTITQEGLLTASMTPGTYTVTVTSGAVTSHYSFTITAVPIASITVTPDTTSLAPGATQQYLALARDADNNVITFVPTWSVDSGGGTISASGLFTAGTNAGDFGRTVRATSGSVSGRARVSVVAGPLVTLTIVPDSISILPADSTTFTAIGHDANGNVVPVTPLWSVVGGGGTFALLSGHFTSDTVAGLHSNSVHATVGLLSATATVNIVAGALMSIAVTPANPAVMTSFTVTFTAVGHDRFNNVVAISSPIWAVVNGNPGSISPGGVFTPGQNNGGQGHWLNSISATADGHTGLGDVTVMCDASCS